MCAHLFAKMDSSAEANGRFDNTYYGVVPPPFLTPEEPLCACALGEVSLTSGDGIDVVISPLQQSSAPAINFVLGASGGNRAPV